MNTLPTIGVCGFGRCGSTMVMRMLHAGGIAPVDGSDERSYELHRPAAMSALTPDQLAGRSVKLLDAVLHTPLPAAASWLFVWVDRDHNQQAKSYAKFVRAITGTKVTVRRQREVARSYDRDELKALVLLRGFGPVYRVSFESILRSPELEAGHLNTWLATHEALLPPLDRMAAAAAVHRRSPKCAPDLTFETTGATP